MGVPGHTPVIVGVGQYKQQLDDVSAALEPYELMLEAVRLAAVDTRAPGLLSRIDRLMIIAGMWRYPDPGRLVADAVGSPQAHTLLTEMGGDIPQLCVSDAAERILGGTSDVVIVCGGEAMYSHNKARRLGLEVLRTGYDMAPAERFGPELVMSSSHEQERGFRLPSEVYPLFESALRAHRKESFDEHRARVGELWSGFNRVAQQNPYAWIRTPMSAEQIVTPSTNNRMVASPYTKSMNANSYVDFGGAIIMCSVDTAAALGVPRDRWVFPHAATSGQATNSFSERHNYYESPAIAITANACLRLAAVGIDEVAHIDLYSCFPSVVQITMAELGLPPDRRVSATGGHAFFGGPMSSYAVHAIASIVDDLRDDPGSVGFVHANGGFATKHACGIYSTEPPKDPFRSLDVQADIAGKPTRHVDESPDGVATVETFTVLHGRGGPERALVTAIMADGARALASSTDDDLMAAMLSDEFVGRAARLSPNGDIHIS